MPVRYRIMLLFSLMVFFILSAVCVAIYYFSYSARIETIRTRLTNRAITTGRLLSQSEVFDPALVGRIDAATTNALRHKTIQAYDYQNNRFYLYSDAPADTLAVQQSVLDEARVRGDYFYFEGLREIVAYHYVDDQHRMVLISAAVDVEGRKNLLELRNILISSFLGGVLIALAGGYFFSHGLLRPIKKITSDVAEISAQNLARRIDTGASRDEWYHLSQTLNELLNRLQESFELQRRFISNASHELSTPLTSISSQLEITLQRAREAREYERVMQSIYQDVRHMNKLTQTLLEFAKASGDRGGLEINLVRVDEILLALPSMVQRANPEYSVALHFDDLPEEEERVLVFGNEELLGTAIRNVVINACKYSPDRRAEVHFRVQGRNLIIVVHNRGEAIPENELQHIFQPFYRVNETENPGFGLGLSLAMRIMKLHKGEIAVQSAAEEGTTFTLNLPAVGHPA